METSYKLCSSTCKIFLIIHNKIYIQYKISRQLHGVHECIYIYSEKRPNETQKKCLLTICHYLLIDNMSHISLLTSLQSKNM